MKVAIETVDEIDSTNSELLRRIEANQLRFPHALRARQQFAGRGRQGREWHGGTPSGGPSGGPNGRPSAAENLYLSIAFVSARPLPELSALTLVLGMAARVALNELFPSLNVQLKWPNDLLCDGEKLGGILLEVAARDTSRCEMVAGIGINIDLQLSHELDRPWTDLRTQGCAIDADALAHAVTAAWLDAIAQFEQHGFTSNPAQWALVDAYFNRSIELPDGSAWRGAGIEADGGYRLEQGAQVRVIRAGDVMRVLPLDLAQTVLIDCGNSRLKHVRANAIVDMQAIAHDFLGQSSPDQSIPDQSIPDQSSAGQSASTQKWLASLQQCVSDQAALGPVSALAFCNVAGDSAEFMRHVQHTFPAARCYELRAKAKIHRWRSSYAQPEKLGADRIAAMLGAMQRHPQQRVLVVVAGTALTLDVVDANGLHLGGLIAPGPDLMQRALQNNTAQLRASASSAELALANSTQSAIANASVWSSVALIHSVASQHPRAHCVLSGGAASALSAHLPAFEVAPSLVLEGLAAWLLFTSK